MDDGYAGRPAPMALTRSELAYVGLRARDDQQSQLPVYGSAVEIERSAECRSVYVLRHKYSADALWAVECHYRGGDDARVAAARSGLSRRDAEAWLHHLRILRTSVRTSRYDLDMARQMHAAGRDSAEISAALGCCRDYAGRLKRQFNAEAAK